MRWPAPWWSVPVSTWRRSAFRSTSVDSPTSTRSSAHSAPCSSSCWWCTSRSKYSCSERASRPPGPALRSWPQCRANLAPLSSGERLGLDRVVLLLVDGAAFEQPLGLLDLGRGTGRAGDRSDVLVGLGLLRGHL